MKILLALFASLLLSVTASAQDMGHEVSHDTLDKYGVYDLDLLPPSFHAERRATLLSQMSDHSIALILSAPEQRRANDIDYLYHQNPNLYYLSGCTEPGSALLLSTDGVELRDGRRVHEILFVRDRNPAQETWTGKRLGPDGARSVLRVVSTMSIDSLSAFAQRTFSTLPVSTNFYYEAPGVASKIRDVVLDSSLTSPSRILEAIAAKFPKLHSSKEVLTLLSEMRVVKSEAELKLMRRAITISNDAHNEVIRNARPGWHEYELQGLAEYIFTKNGAEYNGYPCIVGSGPNSTILHYESNRRQTKANEFIEMDMGAEYHGYSADVTRSFPVSGKFSQEQRAIYELVLEAQDSGIAACKAGGLFYGPHFAAVSVISRGLKRLGIISDSASYKKYFMHGTSHYLGLDVHDAGAPKILQVGNVLTVEPGIYIAEGSPCDPKWWNIGCRIEDDILITASGHENLSSGSPRTIPDLERMMSEGRKSNVTGSR